MLSASSAERNHAIYRAGALAALTLLVLMPGWRTGSAQVPGQTPAQPPAQPAKAPSSISPTIQPVSPPASPAVSTTPGPSAIQPSGRFVVVIDAAHGGDDSGAQLGGSVAEKNITLGLSVHLRSLLTARGFYVVTTREGNLTLEPDARAQIANRAGSGSGAAACLSLHATQAGTGVHIFVSSLPPTTPTRFLAWKTAQSAYVTRSLQLSSVINSAFERGSDAGPITANLARTSLPGIDSMACPAVALEIAPVRDSDGQIETEVTDADYQSRIVDALAAAMLEWRTNWEGNSPKFSPAPVSPQPAPKAIQEPATGPAKAPATDSVPKQAPAQKPTVPSSKPAGGVKTQ